MPDDKKPLVVHSREEIDAIVKSAHPAPLSLKAGLPLEKDDQGIPPIPSQMFSSAIPETAVCSNEKGKQIPPEVRWLMVVLAGFYLFLTIWAFHAVGSQENGFGRAFALLAAVGVGILLSILFMTQTYIAGFVARRGYPPLVNILSILIVGPLAAWFLWQGMFLLVGLLRNWL